MKSTDTIENRVLTFFDAADDEEEITAGDCALKGWGHARRCSQVLGAMESKGLLQRTWRTKGFVYTRAARAAA